MFGVQTVNANFKVFRLTRSGMEHSSCYPPHSRLFNPAGYTFSSICVDPGPYTVTSPENTYPRGKHGEIKVHRSNACVRKYEKSTMSLKGISRFEITRISNIDVISNVDAKKMLSILFNLS